MMQVIKVENRRGEQKPAYELAALVEPRRIGFAQTSIRKSGGSSELVQLVGSTFVGSAEWWPRIADWRRR